MYVCLCHAVTDHQINAAVDSGITSFEGVQKELSVSKSCGNCACEVKNILRHKLKKELSQRAGMQTAMASTVYA